MRLQVGVIGLGRCWRRYRPLLAQLREYVEVRTVCDQTGRRAEIEARQLGCTTAAGPVELLERPDVQAVLLLDTQWYGLWPLEYACRVHKPVFCAVPLTSDESHAESLREQIQSSNLPVLMVLPPLLAPATRRLRELLTHRLGQARLVRADCNVTLRTPLYSAPAGEEKKKNDLFSSAAVLPLLAACAWLLDDVPRNVWALEDDDASFGTLILRFGCDRLAQ